MRSLSLRERARVRGMEPRRLDDGSVQTKARTKLAQTLRRRATDEEMLLWKHLRVRQPGGAKFRRQHPFARFVLDFYCHERALAIEVDGGHHFDEAEAARDEQRTRILEAAGLRVLRFSNLEVLQETEAVLGAILLALEERTPHPNPLPQGEGTS